MYIKSVHYSITPFECHYKVMEAEWMDIAEFSAYVIAVLVGIDMLIARCSVWCKKKEDDAEHPVQDDDDLV